MKKITLIFAALFCTISAFSQLYSSGNTFITGSNVGIGISTPAAKLHIYQNIAAVQEHLRMQNASSTGAGRFALYNDDATKYATFTKYGTAYAGGYTGITSLFPLANLLAFGNNSGGFLVSNSGSIGLSIFKGGTSKLKFYTDYTTENVGIGGNAVPATQIHFNSAVSGDTIKLSNNTTGHLSTDGLEIRTSGNSATIMNRENSTLDFGTNNISRMAIDANGNVVIGSTTTPAGYKLYVEQGILTEKIKVAVKTGSNWADYVFADNYYLKPLHEVESFIKNNKHLPGIPSASEVVEKGLDLAKMDAKLLEKVEELTLYMIKMQKEIDDLKKVNTALQNAQSPSIK